MPVYENPKVYKNPKIAQKQSTLKPKLSLVLICGLFGLSGCTSVSFPKLDFLETPEFAEEAKNIKKYPRAADAPVPPTDVRSEAQWDKDALELMKLRDDLQTPDLVFETLSKEEVDAEVARLKKEVESYKLDDPPPDE